MALDSKTARRLRRTFLNNLPGRMAELAEAMLAQGSPEQRAGARAQATSLAHQLRGTGTSFGCAEITAAGTRAEMAPPEEQASAMEALLEVLGRTIAEDRGLEDRSVLLVGRDLVDRVPLQALVKALGLTSIPARTLAQARAALQARAFDLVVVDLMLPDGDGRRLLSLDARGPSVDASVVVVSACSSSDIKRECFGAGVEHFLDKPLDLPLLCTVMVSAVSRQGRAHAQAATEPLTGAGSRSGLIRAFDRVQAVRSTHGHAVSLAMIDLDRFASFNETWGAPVGDDALRRVARQLRLHTSSEGDSVIRWGGDEFVVVFDGASTDEAVRVLERASVELARPSVDGPPIYLSAGVVKVERGAELATVLDAAETTLQLVKRSGRGRVVVEGARCAPAAERILLVDDDDLAAQGILELLDAFGYCGTHVRTGLRALAATSTEDYALVLLDRTMPGLTGLEVLEHLRRQPLTRELPVLMLTAVGDEDEIVQAFDRGADDYVVKPPRPEELMARIRRLLQRQGRHRARAKPAA